ncbi:hypothetical protein T4A_12157 [Trichinella pseudospiralis]|uniref:Uncharacterized protein n=1 Tax=Trichinella pseudospiralis TaxID=6337 RepID=A0A0V1DKC3_TRIPS|nr:hypothetical protein T4A_12157 [Trichinella pseudospiralis]
MRKTGQDVGPCSPPEKERVVASSVYESVNQ